MLISSAVLGMPLPKRKIKIYRRGVDAKNEFIGEGAADHTPTNETVQLCLEGKDNF